MGYRNLRRFIFGLFLLSCLYFTVGADTLHAVTLTPGATYTISIDVIESSGSIFSLNLSATAVADENSRLSFDLPGVPTNSANNFLLVTIKDSTGAVVRRSLAPAPAAGTTLGLGVSPLTEDQTQMLLNAMSQAHTDDPIMILFGCAIVRSGNFSTADLGYVATLGKKAVVDGFDVYLEDAIGTAKMALFRSAIVTRMADYAGKLRDAVVETNASTAGDIRAEAAGFINQVMVEAAHDADFDIGYITASMNAAGEQANAYLDGDGSGMSAAAQAAMNAVMSANYHKLTTERVRKKYVAAITALGATGAQVDKLDTAITNLSNSMQAAFEQMDAAFSDSDSGSLDSSAISTDQGASETTINNAYDTFMTDIAATNAEIGTADGSDAVNGGSGMLGAILKNFMGISGPNATILNNMKTGGYFKFYDSDGNEKNWPITMVIPVTWVANTYGNNFGYTRGPQENGSKLVVPTCMAWLSGSRSNFTNSGPGAMGMSDGMASLMGIREDIDIIMFRRWAGRNAASRDITQADYNALTDKTTADAQIAALTLTKRATENAAYGYGLSPASDDVTGATLSDCNTLSESPRYITNTEEKLLSDLALSRLALLPDLISATTDKDSNPRQIATVEKQAIIDLMMSPDFS